MKPAPAITNQMMKIASCLIPKYIYRSSNFSLAKVFALNHFNLFFVFTLDHGIFSLLPIIVSFLIWKIDNEKERAFNKKKSIEFKRVTIDSRISYNKDENRPLDTPERKREREIREN